jgi:hypothetical protein
MFTAYSPLKGQTATFSIKYKALQKSGDMPDLKDSDPFPLYPPSLLAAGNLLAVDTNISTFNMTGITALWLFLFYP